MWLGARPKTTSILAKPEVGVKDEDPFAQSRQEYGQIGDHRGFADTAFAAGNGEDTGRALGGLLSTPSAIVHCPQGSGLVRRAYLLVSHCRLSTSVIHDQFGDAARSRRDQIFRHPLAIGQKGDRRIILVVDVEEHAKLTALVDFAEDEVADRQKGEPVDGVFQLPSPWW